MLLLFEKKKTRRSRRTRREGERERSYRCSFWGWENLNHDENWVEILTKTQINEICRLRGSKITYLSKIPLFFLDLLDLGFQVETFHLKISKKQRKLNLSSTISSLNLAFSSHTTHECVLSTYHTHTSVLVCLDVYCTFWRLTESDWEKRIQ